MRINFELDLTEGELKRLLVVIHSEALWGHGDCSNGGRRRAWRLLDKIQKAAKRWLDFNERFILRRTPGGRMSKLDRESRKALGV